MIVNHVRINGIWGRYSIDSQIFPDVTIFIGANGTGKTTFLEILGGVLTADLEQLERLSFTSAEISLVSTDRSSGTETLTVEKERTNGPWTIYKYRFGRRKPIEIRYDQTLERHRIRQERLFAFEWEGASESVSSVRTRLRELIEVDSIAVHRGLSRNSPREVSMNTAVDERLAYLLQQFSKYALRIENRLSQASAEFQRDLVLSLLYDPMFDDVSISSINQETNIKDQRRTLIKVFQDLGISGQERRIDEHIKRVQEAAKSIGRNSKENVGYFKLDDYLVIPLMRRTDQISNLLSNLEEKQGDILAQRAKFFSILHNFMPEKLFEVNDAGEIAVRMQDGDQFPVSSLSSGEKQMLIQFLEALLQENRPVLFVSDEPEISLHVDWQEKLLKSLRELNRNAQLLVATHSPDVISGYRSNVMRMEQILSRVYS